MNSFFNNVKDVLQESLQDKELLWNVGPFILLLIMILMFVFWRIKNAGDKAKLIRRLKKRGEGILVDIKIPDGIGNMVHLDCLLLTRAGMLVIDIKDYAGLIFGAASIDAWTQVLGRKSYKFDNPLFQNQERVMAVKSLAFGSSVAGRVIFTSAGEFPKGKPEGVSTPATLDDDLCYLNEYNELSSSMLDDWEQIKRLTH